MLNGFVNEEPLDFTQELHKKRMSEAFSGIDKEKRTTYPLIINGQKIFTDEKITSVNPADKSDVLGYASSASVEQADAAIQAAYEAFQHYRYSSVAERIKYVRQFVEGLQENRYEMNAWIVEESGKNWDEADGEICETIDFCNSYMLEMQELDKGLSLVKPVGEENRCRYIPIGVGLAIPPWNFPLALMAGMTIAGILTGNTVIIKPASETPIVACKFVEILEKCGLPKGVVNLVTGGGAKIGDYLVKHPKTRFINFTGSKEVGLRINSLAAEVTEGQRWIKRVVAEMGGKNAIIVDSSADIEKAAKGIVIAAFHYQGQKCSACSRAVILADVYDEAVEAIQSEVKKLFSGTGRANDLFGPVIGKKAFDGIVGYIETGKKEGSLILGGGYDDAKGFFIEPTVFADVSRYAVIANEEIFGPVLAIIKAESFDEALEVANDTEYGLTGAVYSKSAENLKKAGDSFYVGNLYFNRKSTGAVVLQHPFGGYNMSGTAAKTGTADYLRNFLQLKAISENIE